MSGAVMIYLPEGHGRSFRCHCQCNVFVKLSENVYQCNACGERYEAS